MGAQGTATLNMGSTPTFEGSVVVTGQAGIVSGSHCEAFIMQEAITPEYDMASRLLTVSCGSVSAGTGFTIYCNSATYATGTISIRWVWN